MGVFSSEEQDKIIHAINLAEAKTSGEIRVAVERKLKGDVMERAQFFFNKLGMHDTINKNGVLIYIAVDDHKFAIIGDIGINQKVGNDFWNSTKDLMVSYFRKNELVEGLIQGIYSAGKQLKTFFPVAEDDINELPNEIEFGDN